MQGDDVGDSDAPRLLVIVGEGEREPVGVAPCVAVTELEPELDPVRVVEGVVDCDLVVLSEADCERVPLDDCVCVGVDPWVTVWDTEALCECVPVLS